MFGRIARRYDLLNRMLSVGIDRRWRRAVVRQAGVPGGGLWVDVCTGTGDLAFEFAQAGASVLGVDFTPQMLTLARRKAPDDGVLFVEGDALCLPVANRCADLAAVAFGLRNVAQRLEGLREMARVVRPGGSVIVLEFSMPPGRVLGGLYRGYFTALLPKIGGLVSGDPGAYRYLPDTVLAWPSPQELEGEMRDVGLVDCGHRLLTRGVACLSFGRVPESRS